MLLLSAALAADRYVEVVGASDLRGNIYDLHQDAAGWIWIASAQGLLRFDGERTVLRGATAAGASQIVSVEGEVAVVVDGRQTLVEVAVQTSPVIGPGGGPFTGVRAAVEAADGAWWVADAEAVWRAPRSGGGPRRWTRIDETCRRLWAHGDSVLCAGPEQLLTIDPAGGHGLAWPISHAMALALDPGGRTGAYAWAGGLEGQIWRLDAAGGAVRMATLLEEWPDALVVRDGSVWVHGAAGLRRMDPEGRLESVALDRVLEGRGPLLLDREGTLWVGGYLGLYRLPEPDTRAWTVADGLSDTLTRRLARVGDRLLAFSWLGLGVIDAAGASTAPIGFAVWPVCTDGAGRPLFAGGEDDGDTMVYDARTLSPVVTLPSPAEVWDCAVGEAGDVWFAAEEGVFHVEAGASSAARVPDAPAPARAVFVDRGVVWVGQTGAICQGVLPSPSGWACEPVEGSVHISDLTRVGDEIWAATQPARLQRHTARGWEVVPGALTLPTADVLTLVPSPRGGVWVAGSGAPIRVESAPETADGWRVLERLGPWNGILAYGAESVWEDADGTAWVATARGTWEVSAEARRPLLPAPQPVRGGVRVDGRVTSEDPVLAPWRESTVELEYAVPTYRDRGRLLWRYRVGGRAWSTPTRRSGFQLVDLHAGRWVVDAEVSLDGERWTAAPPTTIEVRVPWPLRPWALLLWVGLVALGVGGVWHVRAAARRRVLIERTRIAMEIHDELGSGLGGIVVLTGLASDPEIPPEDRISAAEDAGRAAGELAVAVSELSTTLRREGGTLDGLVRATVTRGRRLFADGATRFATQVEPSLPSGPMEPELFRNLQRILAEALHNAARHADASEVRLHVSVGTHIVFVVEDDGVGLERTSPNAGTGSGMEAMRARAAAVGATLVFAPRRGGGTRVELTLPRARLPR